MSAVISETDFFYDCIGSIYQCRHASPGLRRHEGAAGSAARTSFAGFCRRRTLRSKMNVIRAAFFISACLLPVVLPAQLGTWNVLHVRHQPGPRLTVFGEAQIRSLRFYDDFHYYEVKGGASWRLNDQISATMGGGRYDTYMAGGNFRTPRAQGEVRTWAEIGMKNSIGKVNFEHRYRAEQRFTTRGFRHRFRYRLGSSMPIFRGKTGKSELFASVWDEVFGTNRAPYFERNRFFAGLILRRDRFAWHAGWLRQFDYRLTDETGRSFFQIGWQITVSKNRAATAPPALEEN